MLTKHQLRLNAVKSSSIHEMECPPPRAIEYLNNNNKYIFTQRIMVKLIL